ncbi:hypothetical protein F5X68DRAFT_231886 [Plectosphaerella plurivora]|uniref:Uncharacterized protein n=1 Tax=Plectosphaerella plurivora TaxID=936078 RepID=A0A9P8VCY4_9PEZI|nr:hypothetical protein F5X68DRAFT_231886 [Plectosphaerella plurivora]
MPASHVQGEHNVEQSGRQVEKGESQVRRVDHDMSEIQSWVAALPRHVIDKFKKEFNDRLAKAQEAGVCFENITCDDLLLPTWPEPSQYLSSEAKQEISLAIERHLKKEPRLRAFDILASLDLNTAKADTVKGVIATAVAATKPFIDKIRQTREALHPGSYVKDASGRWTLFETLSPGVIAPLLQLLGLEDLSGRQPAIFTRKEILDSMSRKGVETNYQSIVWQLLEDCHFHGRFYPTWLGPVITRTRLCIDKLLMSRFIRCVEAFDAISKSLA